MTKATKELKVHLYDDCSGHYYTDDADVRLTNDVREVTCGQCKGRVLDALRDRDWSDINDRERLVLEAAAELARERLTRRQRSASTTKRPK